MADDEIAALQAARRQLGSKETAPLSANATAFDKDIYGGANGDDFVRELADDDDVVDDYGVVGGGSHPATLAAANAASRIAQRMREEGADGGDAEAAATFEAMREQGSGRVNTVIAVSTCSRGATLCVRGVRPSLAPLIPLCNASLYVLRVVGALTCASVAVLRHS
jgi:hypothetical protein